MVRLFDMSLDYGRRLLGTALSFALFGLGGVLLSLTLFPLINLFVRDLARRKQLGQRIVNRSFRCFIAMMRTLGVLTYSVEGIHHLIGGEGSNQMKLNQGRLIIANHPSLIDVIFLVALFERVDCIVKGNLLKNPFTRGPIKAAGYIPNTGPEQLMDACVASLREGSTLIIFPEGTRTTPGQPLHFRRGAAGMALRANVDLVPVVIRCTPTTLTKAEKWYQIPPSRLHLSLEIKEAIRCGNAIGPEVVANIPLATRKLTQYLEHYFKKEMAA